MKHMTDSKQQELFTRNLLKYIENSGHTQKEIADAIGVSPQTFSTWCRGIAIPRMGKIQKLADYFGIRKSDLIDDRPLPPNVLVPAARAIPILGTICCGDGIDDRSYEGEFFVDKSVRADYCVHVRGDSMIDAHIYDGDMAFLKADYDFQDGKIYGIVIDMPNGMAVLKKIYKAGDHLILQACNSAYKPIICRPEDCRIVGQLAGIYHEY